MLTQKMLQDSTSHIVIPFIQNGGFQSVFRGSLGVSNTLDPFRVTIKLRGYLSFSLFFSLKIIV